MAVFAGGWNITATLGDARAAPSERQAEQSYLRRRTTCGLNEALPLGCVEIFPITGVAEEGEAIVELPEHANLG
jgi:hypothetical protein